MKKIYLVLLAVLGMTVTSCLMEEKELFDKTPAERMEAFLDEYHELLASAEGGWLLQYYPEENQSYGGYAYVVKFTSSDATVWFQLDDDIATPVTSLYKMTPDDGPVLAFDMYNENLHYFATPDVNNYEALHGDYEFRIVGKSEDGSEVYLKGRRTGNNYTLVKFSGDPAEYLNGCLAVEESMTAPAYKITVDGAEGVMSKSNNYIDITYQVGEGEGATFETASVSFCYTPEGVDFYAPVEIAGQTYTGMLYNAQNSTLETEDGKVVISLVFPPLNEVLVGNAWFINADMMTGAIKTAFANAEASISANYGMAVQYIILGPYLYGTYGLEQIIGGYGGSLGLTYELTGEDKIKFKYNSATNQVNGSTFYSGGLRLVINQLVKNTFTVTTDNVRNPSYLLLTDDTNADNTLTLLPPEVPYK